MAQGDVPAEQTEGNDHVDTGAELAHAKQDRWKVDLMPALVARWNHCQQTVAAIQDMMLMIIDATRTRRQQLVDTAQLSYTHRKRLVFAQPLYAPRGLPTLRVRTVTSRLYQPRHASWQLQLQQFLCQWPWVLQTEDAVEQGMTWLELAIAFELHTQTTLPDSNSLVDGPEGELLRRPSIARKSRLMQDAVRRVLKDNCTRNCVVIGRGGLTATQLQGHSATTRLSRLGVSGAWGTMAAWPLLAPELARRVELTILAQRGESREDLAAVFEEGSLLLRPKPLNKAAQPRWTVKPSSVVERSYVGQRKRRPGQDTVRACSFQLQCHRCLTTLVLMDKPARTDSGWQRVRCTSCREQVRVGKAKCLLCLLPMARCHCHATTGAAPRQATIPWTTQCKGERTDSKRRNAARHLTEPPLCRADGANFVNDGAEHCRSRLLNAPLEQAKASQVM